MNNKGEDWAGPDMDPNDDLDDDDIDDAIHVVSDVFMVLKKRDENHKWEPTDPKNDVFLHQWQADARVEQYKANCPGWLFGSVLLVNGKLPKDAKVRYL